MNRSTRSLLLAAALGMYASAASAHHIAGNITCIDTTPATLLGGVTVTVQGTMNTLTGTTDVGGYYNIDLPTVSDTYTVTIAAPAGMTIVFPAAGSYALPIFAFGIGGPDSYDAANFRLTGCTAPRLGKIGDTVYCDANGNGTQEAGEPGIAGVKVNLLCKDANGNTVATAQAMTDANGKYLFNDVPAGICEVTVDLTSVVGDCNVPVCATKVTVNLAAGQIYLDADFCFTKAPPRLGKIGDTVYCDANANGIQDAGEAGIAGVKVNLVCKDANGNTIATAQATTDANGKYLFTDIPAGLCEVTVDTSSVTGDCNVAVCATKVTINLAAGETYLNADFCFKESPESPGTGTPGFWKNHPNAWPVESIVIGGRTYTKTEAIALMMMPDGGDKSRTVFRHLVCAKLNVIIGNESSCISGDIAMADAWMVIHPVGSSVAGRSTAWDEISGTSNKLDNYNNGLLCAPHRD